MNVLPAVVSLVTLVLCLSYVRRKLGHVPQLHFWLSIGVAFSTASFCAILVVCS